MTNADLYVFHNHNVTEWLNEMYGTEAEMSNVVELPKAPEIRLFFTDNNFTVVGMMTESVDSIVGHHLTNAAFIMNSGDKIGFMTLNGPVNSATLQHCGDITIDFDKVVLSIECNAANWVEPLTTGR